MNKIILILIILLFVPSVFAVTNTIISPITGDAMSINPTYDPSRFILLSIINTTTSSTEAWNIDGAGVFTTANTRINEVTATTYRGFYSVEDPSTCTAGICRIVFLLSDGVLTTRLAYTDLPVQDIGKGIYTTSNPNGYHLIATYTGTRTDMHIALNSIGDIFVGDNVNKRLMVYDKSNLYSGSVFYTIDGLDVDNYSSTTTKNIYDVSVDANDNIYVYMANTTNSILAGAGVKVLSPSGTTLQTYPNIQPVTASASVKQEGCIIPDLSNSTQNFHIGFTNTTVGNMYHVAGGALELISSSTDQITDCTYIGGNIWYSTDVSTIETAATSYQGFESNQAVTGTPDNVYTTKTLGSLYANYYNNSDFLVNFNVDVETNAIRELDSAASRLIYGYGVQNNYKWKITLIDTNGIQASNYWTTHCLDTILGDSCKIAGSLQYTPPVNNWTAGSYYAELWEYNEQTYNYALITTSNTWTVGNNSTTPITPPTEPITSGTGSEALSSVDGWTALFGMGVNSISKFLFAMTLIVFFMIVGAILTKMSMAGAVIFGLLPYAFFVFIEYLPSWTVIILGIVVAIKLQIFR